jgi:hypothetical protein
MRGWSLVHRRARQSGDVVPAHAGLVRPTMTGLRPSGPSSPRMRGWSVALKRGLNSLPVVPAHAGLVPGTNSTSSSIPSRPRACGAGPSSRSRPRSFRRSSPRMRGWSAHSSALARVRAVVPAHAGLAPLVNVSKPTARSSPRMRGWSGRRDRQRKGKRSSPHVQGWSVGGMHRVLARRGGPCVRGLSGRLRGQALLSRGPVDTTACTQEKDATKTTPRSAGERVC